MIRYQIYNTETEEILEEIEADTDRKAKEYVYEQYGIKRLNTGEYKPQIRALFHDPNENKREVLETLKSTPMSHMRQIYCKYNCDFIRNYKYRELSTAYILETVFKTRVDFNAAHRGDDANGMLYPDQRNTRIEIKSTVTNDESKLLKCAISFDKQSNEHKRQTTQDIGCLVISLFRFSEYIYPDFVIIINMGGRKHAKWRKFIAEKQEEYIKVNTKSKGRTSRRWQPMNITLQELYNTFKNDIFVIKYHFDADEFAWTTVDELRDRYTWTQKNNQVKSLSTASKRKRR